MSRQEKIIEIVKRVSKSDVAPDPQILDHYRAQVRAYIDMTGAERGLIVLMTSGAVIPVLPTKPTEHEAV